MIGTAKEREEDLQILYPEWKNYTLWTYFCLNSERFSEEAFIVDEECIYTYGDIRRMVDAAGRGFYSCGIRRNSHVAVSMENRVEYIVSIFALAKLGCVKVSVNTKITEAELEYVLNEADVQFLISERQISSELRGRLNLTACILVGADEEAPQNFLLWEEMMERAQTVDEQKIDQLALDNTDPYQMCDIMFTSGSTAKPKGVMLTHNMLLRSAFGTANTRHMEKGRRIAIPIPLFHAMAYVEGLLAVMTVGGSVILFRGKFHAENTLKRMREFHANDIVCVSTVMVRLLSLPKEMKGNFPDLHAAYWAGACPDWVWEAAKEFFEVTDIGTGYGMTECGSTSHLIGPKAPEGYAGKYHGKLKLAGAAAVPAGSGRVLEMRIQDIQTGAPCKTGQTGEIVLRGATITPGYYKRPEETKKVLDEDGWYHTGDLGCVNDEGYLTFLGRNNDTYKLNGENISPRFVESVIEKQQNVKLVEVVGIAHPCCGEVGVAFVETYEKAETTVEDLSLFCRKNLARFQQPEYIFLMDADEWPKTHTGKISKRALRTLAVQKIEGRK